MAENASAAHTNPDANLDVIVDPAGVVNDPAQYQFPVSFAQQRLWFLDQLEGPSAVYNVKLPVRLVGELDFDILQQAIDLLVDRHESLRTTIVMKQGEPVQVVHASLSVPLQIIDMQADDEVAIRDKAAELAGEPFNLERGPLFRSFVMRTAPDDQLLLLVTHHVISDAWSSSVLFRDLAAIYTALVRGQTPVLAELPVQYADYAVWQREWLEGAELERQAAYWKNKLLAAPHVLALPTDRPRPPRQTYNGSRYSLVLSRELTAALKALAAEQSCTLFMVMLAAFNVLLGRYAGQDDVLIGSPIAGRRRTELEGLVGLFVNTLVFRNDLSGNPSFRSLLSRVRETALEAFGHQELPFEKLVEIMQPVRDMSHSPLFQVMFIQQNAPWDAGLIPGLEVSPGEIGTTDTAKYDLSVSAAEYEHALWLNFEYNTDLFDVSTIERLSTGFHTVLQAVVADPDVLIQSLPLQTAADQAAMTQGLNRTDMEYDKQQTVHGLIREQACRTPDVPAVECSGQSWSYRQLGVKADALAAELQATGLHAGGLVAVCVERSPAMLSAVLGVLEAGCAYLPLDPNFPGDRLGFMLEDSGCAVLVTTLPFPEQFADFSGHIICLDEDGVVSRVIQAQNIVEPDSDIADESLAYLIYTSGSTGKPKGVRVPHRAVVNFLLSMAQCPGIDQHDRLLAVTTLSFDISVLELFLPLTVGATVVMAPADTIIDGYALAALIDTAGITLMQATPATWRLLVNADWQGNSRLTALCGGEALDRVLAQQLSSRSQSLWNMYGPTETTIWSACQRITDADAVITVGRPIANTQMYVLDESMVPVPAGVAGELFIGGDGVTAGYHHRSPLTVKKFVPDPFGGGPQLYRTGDRARFRAGGCIEILGRTDQQIKLRGFRIEPGEIESVLAAHPGIRECVVSLADGERLAAWIVPDGPAVAPDALRDHLKAQLPDYMIPGCYVSVPSLPLTPNGKVDRRSLPAPDWGVTAAAQSVAPRTPLESALAGLFAEVLGVDGVGVHDNFFDHGGHSLMAMRLVSRIRDAMAIELQLQALFGSPTVAGLAACLTADVANREVLTSGAAELARRGPVARERAPASYMQQRLWFLDQLEPGNPVYNLVWSMGLDGELDVVALNDALQALVARHESLRTTFADEDGTPVQVIAEQLPVEVSVENPARGAEHDLDARLVEIARAPFDLRCGPLLRVTVLRRSASSAVLLIVIHHIVADGWSMAVLFRELAALYNARVRNRAADLPALPLQYADYTIWQRDWLSGDELRRQLDYWAGQLAGAPPVLNLPTDRPRPRVQTYRGARLSHRLPVELLDQLTVLGRSEKSTLFMVLLAGFNVLLARYGGQEDIIVGTPVAGRQWTEIENLIGFFINTLVLRTDLSGNPEFRTVLRRVRQTALQAYAHQDLPFEKLVDELKPERDTSRTPVFQVMFNLHNEPVARINLDGLEVRPFGVDRGTAKFDLTVSLTQTNHGLLINFEYNADLFTDATMQMLALAYEQVLFAAVSAPDTRVASLPLDAHGRMQRIAPAVSYQPFDGQSLAGNLVARFEAQVNRDARRPAVRMPGVVWSYGELNEQANRVANALLAGGPLAGGPSAGGMAAPRVGLMCAQDAPLIAGLLGILKAGAAYVPLDPGNPPLRNEGLIADTGIEVIVAGAAYVDQALALAGVSRVICTNGADSPVTNPGIDITGEMPAYVLYTSGSTGEPKGVVQTHAGVLKQLATYTASLHLNSDDCLSLLSGYSFDAAVQDIFGALLNGASVVPVDVRGVASAGELLNRLVAERITVLHATPTVYRYLVGGEMNCAQDLSTVRLVVLGGEPVRRSDFELFKARFARGAVLVNGFGLTESTLALQFFADHESRMIGDSVPVGTAVEGMQVSLIDQSGHASWIGEIVLTGDAIAQGYWNKLALTASRFGTDAQGRRFYKTGDIGRLSPDGQIVYIGRADEQVKLRGFRIEPGEVEAVLSAYPGVSESVVTVSTTLPGDSRLVACVVSNGSSTIDVDELRAFCRTRLPVWMQPQGLVLLDKFPRLGSGKVDRRALPAPEWSGETERYVPPRTELEALLSSIWCEVLGVDQVGAHDDFFALGGHSLLATRLISRIRDTLRVELPLQSLFESPTVAGLADTVDAAGLTGNFADSGIGRRSRIFVSG
jgi:amino acid adenylation domain-containing protein